MGFREDFTVDVSGDPQEVFTSFLVLADVYGFPPLLTFEVSRGYVTVHGASQQGGRFKGTVDMLGDVWRDTERSSNRYHYHSRESNSEFTVTAKQKAVRALKVLGADSEIIKALNKVKVAQIQSAIDSSDDCMYRMTYTRKEEAPDECTWTHDGVAYTLIIAGDRNYRQIEIKYTFKAEVEEGSAVATLTASAEENGVKLIKGVIR